VYALGAILHECLTGRPPFRAATTYDTILQVVSEEPVPPRKLNAKVPADLETICLKCLHKEPSRRYSSARELADDLGRFRDGRAIVARPVGRLGRAAKWVRRNPVLAGMMAVAVLALVAGTGISVGFALAAEQEAERARQNEAEALRKGEELARTAAKLKRSSDALERTAADLRLSRDELETTLARSLVSALALQGVNTARPADLGWEALWELATNRRGRLGYRFVEEASRTPAGSRVLRDRAALVLSAAVGLDDTRRAEVEALLMARLDDPALSQGQKTDLALAASAWDGLSRPAALRTARALTHAMTQERDSTTLYSLAYALSRVTARTEPRDAVTSLVQAIKGPSTAQEPDSGPPPGWYCLPQALEEAAARMAPRDGASTLLQVMKDTPSPDTLSQLASGLSRAAVRMESRDAAAAAAQAAALLVQAMKDARSFDTLSRLARSLSEVAVRMEPRDAAPAAGRATSILIQAIRDNKNPQEFGPPESGGLAAVAALMAPRDVAPPLLQAMKGMKDPRLLEPLAHVLSDVAARMPPEEAATTAREGATALVLTLKHAKDPGGLWQLAFAFKKLAPLLESGEAARVAAQFAPPLLQAIKKEKDARQDPYNNLPSLAYALSFVAPSRKARDAAETATTLLQVIKEAKSPDAAVTLAHTLSALAARLESGDAARVANALVLVMNDARGPRALGSLTTCLSALANRMEPADALAAAEYAALARAAFLQAMKQTRDLTHLEDLASGLTTAAARMGHREAAQAAPTLVQLVKDTRSERAVGKLVECLAAVARRMEPGKAAAAAAEAANTLLARSRPTRPRGKGGSYILGSGLAALAPHMEAREAATILLQATKNTRDWATMSHLLVALRKVPSPMIEDREAAQAVIAIAQLSDNSWESYMPGLSPLIAAVPGPEIPSRGTSVAAAVASWAGAGQPLGALGLVVPAAEPPPCRLSTQQLVDLLKMPAGTGPIRRLILDQFGNRYRRTFRDVWEFVRFAQESRLGLDFTTPPKRPDLFPSAGK
jgi:hypothetical protein